MTRNDDSEYTTLVFRVTAEQARVFEARARELEAEEEEPGLYWAGNLGGWVEDPEQHYHHLQIESDKVVYRGERRKFFTEGHADTVMRVLMEGLLQSAPYPTPVLFLCDNRLIKQWWQGYRHYLPYWNSPEGASCDLC